MKNRNIAVLLLAIAGAAASCSKTEIVPDKGNSLDGGEMNFSTLQK